MVFREDRSKQCQDSSVIVKKNKVLSINHLKF